MPKEFENIFRELLDNGANAVELGFWKEMIPVIGDEERGKLKENFEKQLELLKQKAKLAAEGK